MRTHWDRCDVGDHIILSRNGSTRCRAHPALPPPPPPPPEVDWSLITGIERGDWLGETRPRKPRNRRRMWGLIVFGRDR
jgi:hypothetical protein